MTGDKRVLTIFYMCAHVKLFCNTHARGAMMSK